MFADEFDGEGVAGVEVVAPFEKLGAVDLKPDRDGPVSVGVANAAVVAPKSGRTGKERAVALRPILCG